MKNNEIVSKIKEEINFVKGKFTAKIFNDKINELENFSKLKEFNLFLENNKQFLSKLTENKHGTIGLTHNIIMYESLIFLISDYIKQSEKMQKIQKIKSSINAYKPIFKKEIYVIKISELEKMNKVKEFKSFVKKEKLFLDELSTKFSNISNNEEIREDLLYENIIDMIKLYTQK